MGDNTAADDTPLFPETMSTLNCVPDSAVLQARGLENTQKVQFNGVLDNLPQIMTKSSVISPIMIERFGIGSEYLNMEQGHQSHGKTGYQGSRKLLCQEQASRTSQKVVARLLTNLGFESSSDTSLEVLRQLLSCHIGKLGRTLKLLADSYRRQCSATELLKMFLQTTGYSNLGMKPQQQPSIRQPHQNLRQMSRMNNPQYLAFQQQQQQQQPERMIRWQQSNPRPGMTMNITDKDRPLVQVKMENPSDFPLDTNAFPTMNSRQQQFRQQQLAAISSLHASANNNNAFGPPMTSLQIPQIQSPNMSMTMARAQPVKVEGFQEQMGGDSTLKHDLEENKLLFPQK